MTIMQQLLKTSLHFNRQVKLFFLIIIGLGFAIDGVYTVLLNLYLLRLGYTTDFIGLINAVGLLTFAVASLPAGLMGSRWSNTRLMKVGVVLITVGGVLLPIAESVPVILQDSWLVVTYATMMCGFSFFFVNGEPYLLNVVDSKRRNDAFAFKAAMLSLAAFLGSLIGGIVPEFIASLGEFTLDDPEPYRSTLLIVSVVLVASLVLAFTVKAPPDDIEVEQSMPPDASKPMPLATPQWTTTVIMLIGVMTIVRLLQVAGMATVVVYFNVYMDTKLQVSTGVIGTIAAIGRFIGIPAALFVPTLIDRWGKVNVIIWGSMATAAFLLPIALVDHWIAAAIGYIGVMSISFMRYTAFVVYILELVPKVQQSVMAGSGEMAAGLSFSMMALGGGIILSLFTFRDLFLVGAVLTFIGTFVFWLHFRFGNNKRKIRPAIQI